MRKYLAVCACALALLAAGVLGGCAGGKTAGAQNEEENMDREEAIGLIQSVMDGFDESWAGEADGYKDEEDEGATSAFVKVTIAPGREQEAVAWIEGLCGEGSSADSRPLPGFENRICEELREEDVDIQAAYDFLTAGKNGAKSRTVEIYLARKDGVQYIYFLRL